MPANTTPIYSIAGQIEWNPATLKTANTAMDGTGTVATIFTAGANGGRVERIRSKPYGTNIATVLRIFINNGGDNAVSANNNLYVEKVVSAYTQSQTAAAAFIEVPDTIDTTCFPLVLPAGYRLLATIGTTVANGLQVTVVGSQY